MATTSIRQNLLQIQERIAAATARVGRRPEDITLIGVSKTHPAIAIQEAFQAGVRHFGENRVQEWEVKRVGTNNLSATWHLIGHLQSNKAAKEAKLFHTVDSVDDLAVLSRGMSYDFEVAIGEGATEVRVGTALVGGRM